MACRKAVRTICGTAMPCAGRSTCVALTLHIHLRSSISRMRGNPKSCCLVLHLAIRCARCGPSCNATRLTWTRAARQHRRHARRRTSTVPNHTLPLDCAHDCKRFACHLGFDLQGFPKTPTQRVKEVMATGQATLVPAGWIWPTSWPSLTAHGRHLPHSFASRRLWHRVNASV